MRDTAGAAQDRVILHVDMDAFYASVEVLLDPSLRGKPVIVGGDGPRGVVASCSYEARAYGIRSAMASTQARRLCPHAVFVRGNHGLYADYSRRIHEVFARFTPVIEGIALDEAFLDVSGARRLFGDGAATAASIRAAVFDETGLRCAVGVARTKLLAKLASKEAKPPVPGARPRATVGIRRPSEGVAVVDPADELAFLQPLPVRALWGVGPKTFERLQRFGVSTVGDLARLPVDTLVRTLGDAQGRHLHQLSNGIDERPVEVERPMKSIGHEETFAVDHHELEPLERELLRMSDAVASRVRHSGLRGRTVQLKLKLADFRILTRARTLGRFVDSATAIHTTALELLRAEDLADEVAHVGVRLLGVSLSRFDEAGVRSEGAPGEVGDDGADAVEQLGLFDPPGGAPAAPATGVEPPRDTDPRLTRAVDEIRARFGAASVGPAALADRGALRVKQPGDTQWGPSAPDPDQP